MLCTCVILIYCDYVIVCLDLDFFDWSSGCERRCFGSQRSFSESFGLGWSAACDEGSGCSHRCLVQKKTEGCVVASCHVFMSFMMFDGCNVVWKSHIVYAMIHVSMESSKVSRRLAVLWINDIEKQRSVALQLTTSDLCSKHRSCTLSKIYAVLWRLWRFLRRWWRLNDLNAFSTGTQSIWIINRWYHCFLCTWKLAANDQFIGTPRLQRRDVYWISIAVG